MKKHQIVVPVHIMETETVTQPHSYAAHDYNSVITGNVLNIGQH
jgi:hypothetical protein